MTYKTLFSRNSTFHEEDAKLYMTEQQFKKAFMLIREHTIRQMKKEFKVPGFVEIENDELVLVQDVLELTFSLKEYE